MIKYLKVLIVGLIIINMVTYTNISMASNKTDLQNEKTNLNNSISQAKDDLEDIQKEKSDTLNEVESLMSKIADYQDEIDELDSQISDLQKKIKDDEKKIKEDEEEQERQQAALDERIVTMYENGDISFLDVILSSNGLTDFISSCFMVSELVNYDTEMIQQVEDHQKQLEEEKAKLESSKKTLDDAKSTKSAKANALKTAKKEKEEKASQLSADEKKTQKEIEEMLEDKAKIDKELQRLAKEEAERLERERKAREEAAKNNNSSSSSNNNSSNSSQNTSPSSAGYIFPVKGCSKSNIRVLSYPSYAGHTGVDVNIGVTGKNVVAVKSGTVITSTAIKNSDGSYRSYGEYVMINHGDGTITLYAHMLAGSRKVIPGQKVSQGQVIGTVGSTGNSTGTHLHFEVRTLANSFRPVNPIPYLP